MFSAQMDKDRYKVGEYVKLTISFDPQTESDTIGAFITSIAYDPEVMSYVKTSNLSESYTKSSDKGDYVKTVLTAKNESVTGELYTCYFKCIKEFEQTSLVLNIKQAVDYDAQVLCDDITIDFDVLAAEKKSSEAELLDLVPDYGMINETIDPKVHEYTMDVPYSVKSLKFHAEVSPGAVWSVNRKNLGSGGSNTDFIFTITAEDGVTKNQYTLTVTRGEYKREPNNSKEHIPLLLSLIPSEGSLNETFSSHVNDYTMTVPFSVKSLEFTLKAEEGARCHVNRKNLGAGGSETLFKITVTDNETGGRNIYNVMVKREERVGIVAAEKDKSDKSGKNSGISGKRYSADVIDQYTDGSDITIQSDTFKAFMVGILVGAGSSLLGGVLLLLLSKNKFQKNKK